MVKTNRRKRKYENEVFYEIAIESWEAHVSFNDYLYMNIFDSAPHEEKIYICLNGHHASTRSKKVKKGKPCRVVLHPSDYWDKPHHEEAEDSIGDMIIYREPIRGTNKDYLMARVSIPFRSYELIRSYLTYKASGTIRVVGTEMIKRKGTVFQISFDARAT